jgi:hypothetical protein
MKKIPIVFFIYLLFFQNIFAQDLKDRLNISGSIFSDYYYNIDNAVDSLKDVNGFRITRIFFTTDFVISKDFDARFRLEANQSSGSLTLGGKLGVMLKDAFLKWKNIFDGSDLIFGLSPTPIYEISEVWGYRCLEKSPTDLLGIIPFRDIGVDLRGKLTEDGSFNYHIKIGNNSNNMPEVNKYKRYYALVTYKFLQWMQLGLYGDYASAQNKKDFVDGQSKNNDQLISALFLTYYQPDIIAFGANTFFRTIQNNFSSSPTKTLRNQNEIGYSFWAWLKLSDKFRLVGRLDGFDPNSDMDNDANMLSLIGLDYRPVDNVSIIPNFEMTNYLGTSKKDISARLTVAYQF